MMCHFGTVGHSEMRLGTTQENAGKSGEPLQEASIR